MNVSVAMQLPLAATHAEVTIALVKFVSGMVNARTDQRASSNTARGSPHKGSSWRWLPEHVSGHPAAPAAIPIGIRRTPAYHREAAWGGTGQGPV